MPTGTCNYPDHHGPSAGQPIALLILIAIGAVIITHWRTVVVCVIVTAVLIVLTAAVATLWHRRHQLRDSARELDADPRRQLGAQQRPSIEAPAVHNHLHLHGVQPSDLAAIVRHYAIEE